MFLPKWVFFAWEASWSKVFILDRLKRTGWSLANRCFLCLAQEEFIDHILIHCTKTRVLQDLLFALFSVTWVLSWLVREILLGWYDSFVGKKRKKIWMVASFCLFWTVWKERNRIAFDDEELLIHMMKNSFLCSF